MPLDMENFIHLVMLKMCYHYDAGTGKYYSFDEVIRFVNIHLSRFYCRYNSTVNLLIKLQKDNNRLHNLI